MEGLAEQLAGDLASAHPLLGDRVTWRRIVLRAIDGSDAHRVILRGVREDLACRAAALFFAPRLVRGSVRPRQDCAAACGLGARTATRVSDGGLVHQDTMLASAAACECPR